MIQEQLNIFVIQTELFWEDRARNLAHFANLMHSIEEADIIVLPETFTTGFSMKREVAERGTETIDWMRKMAAEKNCAIAGSFFVNEDEKCYNRMHFVEPSGRLTIYNKRHLFCLTNEDDVFTAGDKQVIVEYKGWKISLMVCYDLRFPVWMRRTIKHNYDAVLLVANWPEKRNLGWKQLLVARAIENQAYVIGCNRVGEDAMGNLHSGDSMVVDAMGEHLAISTASKEMILNAKIQFPKLELVRKALPFFEDADKFEL